MPWRWFREPGAPRPSPPVTSARVLGPGAANRDLQPCPSTPNHVDRPPVSRSRNYRADVLRNGEGRTWGAARAPRWTPHPGSRHPGGCDFEFGFPRARNAREIHWVNAKRGTTRKDVKVVTRHCDLSGELPCNYIRGAETKLRPSSFGISAKFRVRTRRW